MSSSIRSSACRDGAAGEEPVLQIGAERRGDQRAEQREIQNDVDDLAQELRRDDVAPPRHDEIERDEIEDADDEGNPVLAPKYSGFHALRHWYASWCINRKADGGLELTAKAVQGRMGHSSIQVTFDTYGHMFPAIDEGAEMAAAERALFAIDAT